MVMPPKIKSGDLVRMEEHTLGIWREQDIIKQVMRGEEIWKDNDKRIFAFNVCNSGKAEDVTELYRYMEEDCGFMYRLIWRRPPRDVASRYSVGSRMENEHMWRGTRIYFDTENREVLDEAQAKDLCNTCFESTPGNIVSGCEEEFGDCWLLKDITEDVTRKIGMMGRIARRADEEFDW